MKETVDAQTNSYISSIAERKISAEEINVMSTFLQNNPYPDPNMIFSFVETMYSKDLDEARNNRKDLLFNLRLSIAFLTKSDYYSFVEYLEEADNKITQSITIRINNVIQKTSNKMLEDIYTTDLTSSMMKNDKDLINRILVITNDDTIN